MYKINALAARHRMWLGEWPYFYLMGANGEAFYGRDPFDAERIHGLSPNLMIPEEGTLDGHNTLEDTTILDGTPLDKAVPISPLFVRDLAGRPVYIGFGPERKTNLDWLDYRPPVQDNGNIAEEDFNPYIPLCTFPRFCRDVQRMEGADLLEQVFFTKFRCLEMGQDFTAMPTGGSGFDDLMATTYLGANLYPYKLRLDTFYTDGWKLPQTQMLFARGEAQGVDPAKADMLGERLLESWRNREVGQSYDDFLEVFGKNELERLFTLGCTLIPTFEACNGYHAVGRNFELEDYWPGRAVLGLHIIMDARKDKAPEGTILQVVTPGYITATKVVPAQVIVSDGSGYVSPNAADPLPMVPNLFVPHTRALASWRTLWVPTHPEHFEAPALWGWDVVTGRFLQLMGPLWDPLHYYYASVDVVIKAFESPIPDSAGLVAVPEEMQGRFYPVVPMSGFDTFSKPAFNRREAAGIQPLSLAKRVPTTTPTAPVGYHPLPAEFEFELDPFWFPELHPLNREQGACPEDLLPRLAPVIRPQVTVTTFINTVEAGEGADESPWLKDPERMLTPTDDPLRNYPFLSRYILEDLSIQEVMRISPLPFLSDPGDLLTRPPELWWQSPEGEPYDSPLALEEMAPGSHDVVWDMRQQGVDMVRLRHAIYRTQLPLYILAWWYGTDAEMLGDMMEDLLESGQESVGGVNLTGAADRMTEAQGQTRTEAEERQAQSGFVGMRAPEEHS